MPMFWVRVIAFAVVVILGTIFCNKLWEFFIRRVASLGKAPKCFLEFFLLQIFTVAALLSILSFLISNSGWIEAMTVGFLVSIFLFSCFKAA